MADPTEFYVYFVSWPGNGIVKVGYASHRRARIARYVSKRGGHLHMIVGFSTHEEAFHREHLALSALRSTWPRRFSSAIEAEPFLGLRGSGWTECLSIPDADVDRAALIVKEVLHHG